MFRSALALLLSLALPAMALADNSKPLRIGITLHPYYSYVSNIVGDKAEVVPLIPAGFNPHAYEPRAEDIKRIGTLDVVVLNGVGHDDFADRMIATSENPTLPLSKPIRTCRCWRPLASPRAVPARWSTRTPFCRSAPPSPR